MIILKEKIIEKMKEKNLSIAALERKAGLSIHSIRNILKGKIKNPRAETLPAIAEALECSLLELIDSSSSFSGSWQGNNIANKQNNCLEHPDLMIGCTDALISLLEEQQCGLSVNRYLEIVKTLYLYSLPSEPKIPDLKFAKWLLEEKCILQPPER